MKFTKKIRRTCLVVLCLLSFFVNLIWHGMAPGRSQTASQPVSAFAGNPTLQKLAEADRLFLAQDFTTAEKLYREVKPALTLERPMKPPTLIFDASQLDGGASVYWRQAREGIDQKLESKVFISLQLLTENYPEFIPAHIELARACQQDPEGCKRGAKAGQPDNAIAILERASFLYLDQTDLLDARIATFAQAERWLEASIAARQFALTFPKHAQAEKYAELAKTNFKQYEAYINQKLSGNLVAVGLISSLTGDKSGAELMLLLLQGEAKVGQQLGDLRKQEFAGKNQLVTDPKVVELVNKVGQDLAKRMGRDEFTYEFTVFRDAQMNAFALPGGKIFISTGLLQNLRTEAELAGVLSHEIAHSVLSHGFEKMAESAIISNITQMIPFGSIVKDAASAAGSQAQERQSDILGTRTLANAEYAADGLRNVLVLFREQNQGNSTPEWLQSHPAPADRVRYVEDLILRNGFNRYAYEGVVSMANLNGQLQGLPSVEYARSPGPAESALSGEQVKPTAVSTLAPEAGPAKPTPAGKPEIVARLERDQVTIRLDSVEVKRSGAYTVGLLIENQSDRPFIVIRNFIQVLNIDNEPVTISASLDSGAEAGIAPGGTLRGQIQILDRKYRWKKAPSQDLTLIIKESSSGARVFRIPF